MKNTPCNAKTFGLIGTITKDYITFESHSNRSGIGGALYQAAALCGMGHRVRMITKIGEELLPEFNAATHEWKNLDTEGMVVVSGPGNQVHLFYPNYGERKEVLASVVPSLTSGQVFPFLSGLDMLILVFNSGFDITLHAWKDSLKKITCPTWLDIHSLVLEKKFAGPRDYIPFPEWQEWVEGVTFLQANRKEVASALGDPGRHCGEDEILSFSQTAFKSKVKAVFVTLGREGVMVLTPGHSRRIGAPPTVRVVDTTGCGDVFCAAAVDSLASGHDCFRSAEAGVRMAARAAETAGVEEIYYLAGT